MRRLLAILLSVALMVPCVAIPAYADDTKVSSLYFTVDTSGITPGTHPDDIDRGNLKVICTTVTDNGGTWKNNSGTIPATSSEMPNLRVNVTDVQCTNNDTFVVGDTVKFKFWFEVGTGNKGSQGYYVTSGTTVHVRNKDDSDGPKIKSVSKSRQGSYEFAVTVNTNGIKGQYTEPRDLEWQSGSLGQAKWNHPEDGNYTSYYDVKLLRDGRTVYTEKNYNNTFINLYPWMTKEGDYSFAVRSIPITSGNGAKASEWTESDSQDVPKEKVSDGSGQVSGGGSSTNGKVGWQQINGKWYFFYPDGTMKKNGWEKIQNLWYLFDASGIMLTGWQNHKNNTYYLDPSKGNMKTGWINTSDGQWYWLNPDPAAGTEGAMFKDKFLDKDGHRYYLTSSGAMATGWTKIGNDQYYFNPNSGGPKGAMVTNQRVDSFWLGADGKWVKGQ